MSEEGVGSITELYQRLRTGDGGAGQRFFERFLPRLLGLAHRALAGRPQRLADADDAVQSAFISFFEQVRDGRLGDGLDRDDLWNLLGLFTVRKSRKQARRERAGKRGGGRVVPEADLAHPAGDAQPLDQRFDRLPAVDLDLAAQELLERLDPELRQLATLRLMGFQNREIADELGWTLRKVERKVQIIRMLWQRELDAN